MEKWSSKEADNGQHIVRNLEKEIKKCVATIDGLIDVRARGEIEQEPYERRLAAAKSEKGPSSRDCAGRQGAGRGIDGGGQGRFRLRGFVPSKYYFAPAPGFEPGTISLHLIPCCHGRGLYHLRSG